MIVILDTGKLQDLTDAQMKTLDSKLRSRFLGLIGWSYSPLTGELTLDFGEVDEEALLTKIADIEAKAEGKRKRLELLEMIKRWPE